MTDKATIAMLRTLLRPLIDAAVAWACSQDPVNEVIRAECEHAETLLAATEPESTAFIERVRAEERAKCEAEWEKATAFASQPKTPTMRDIITKHDTEVRAAVLEEAAKTLCSSCHRGVPFISVLMRHREGSGFETKCSAQRLRQVFDFDNRGNSASTQDPIASSTAPVLGCAHGRLPGQPCPHCMGIGGGT